MSKIAGLESEILKILARNNVSRKLIWNQDVLFERLPENDYELYWTFRNERDEYINDVFDDEAGLLRRYNELLLALGYEEQDTIIAVMQIIRRNIFISIYDFIDGKYERHKKNLHEFRQYLLRDRRMIYPLQAAKSRNLRLFLKSIFNA